MLERPLGEILALGYPLEFGAALYQSGRDTTKPKLNGKPNSYRPTSHDNHLLIFRYDVPPNQFLPILNSGANFVFLLAPVKASKYRGRGGQIRHCI